MKILQSLILALILVLALVPSLTFANSSDQEEALEPFTTPEVAQHQSSQQQSSQQQSSTMTCYAYTDCVGAYGQYIGRVSCQVHGYQYLQQRGVSASHSCTWFVQPYVAVECSGYQKMYNPYTRQYYWAWSTVTSRCPGR